MLRHLFRSVLVSAAVLGAGCGPKQAPPAMQPPPTAARTAPAASSTPSALRQQWLDMFARGYFPGRSGQVFVVPKEKWFVTSHDPLYTFMHGSPWDYDTHIPVLFYGS